MRVNIYLSEETERRLREYVAAQYGGHKALSLTVQQAIEEFLIRANLDPRLRSTAAERRVARIKYAGKEGKDE